MLTMHNIPVALLATLLTVAILMIIGWRKGWYRRRAGRAVLIAFSLLMCVGILFAAHQAQLWNTLQNEYRQLHYEPPPMPPAHNRADVHDLPGTQVTHQLAVPMPPSTNVLWTAGLALGWKQVQADHHGNAAIAKEPVLTAELDASPLSADSFAPGMCTVVSGKPGQLGNPDAEAMAARYGLSSNTFVSATTLKVNLPFEWKYNRLQSWYGMWDEEVAVFGNMSTDDQEKTRFASQLTVHDAQSSDDFILEFHTRTDDHRLILAKIPPAKTLKATIEQVRKRLDKDPQPYPKYAELCVPVIDFDIASVTPFDLQTGSQILPGVSIEENRFLLNEAGAKLELKTLYSVLAAMPESFRFDKPFLILLTVGRKSTPYAAFWIANKELMVTTAPAPAAPQMERP